MYGYETDQSDLEIIKQLEEELKRRKDINHFLEQLNKKLEEEIKRRKAINDFIDQLSKEQLEALRQIITLREDDKEYNCLSAGIQSYYKDFIDTKLSEQQTYIQDLINPKHQKIDVTIKDRYHKFR